MPGECRGADRGGLSIGAVLKRHAPRCSGGGHEPAHPARCQGRHPQCRDRARPHRQPHPRAQSGRRPPAGQATDRGGVGGAELERAPAQPCPLGERAGAAGRPPLGPGCATAPRTPAGDERVAGGGTAGHARAATLPDDGPSIPPGPGSATARPLKGRAAITSSMRPRRIRELSPDHGGQRRERLPPCPYSSANHRTSPNMHSETTLPCASTMTAS